MPRPDYSILRTRGRALEQRETLLNYNKDIEVMSCEEAKRGLQETKPLCKEKHNPGKVTLRDGAEMYCEDFGKGIPIITIHGGPGATHHVFHKEETFDKLSEQGFRILHPDMRGCGESDWKPGPEGSYTVDQAVLDLKDVLDKKEIGKAVFAAHSFGNTVLHRFAELFPDRVAGMVLIAPYCAGVPLEKKSDQKSFISEEEKAQIQSYDASSIEGLVQRIQAGDWRRQFFYKPTKEELFQIQHEWKHDPIFRDQIGDDLMSNSSTNGDVFDKNIPTAIFWGNYDWTLPGTPEELQRYFKGSEIYKFEQSSHNPFADEPEKFIDAMKGFISRIPDVNLQKSCHAVEKKSEASRPESINLPLNSLLHKM